MALSDSSWSLRGSLAGAPGSAGGVRSSKKGITIPPFTPAAVPWNDEFDWSALNYAPLMVGGVFIAVWIWWAVSAKNHYTGPVQNIHFDEGMGITAEEPTDTPEPPAAAPPPAPA